MDDDEYYGFCAKHPADEPEPERREYFVLLRVEWPFAQGGCMVTAGWAGTMMLDPTQTKKDQYWEVIELWNVERRRDGLGDLPSNALTTLYHVVPNEADVLPGTETEA